MRFLFTTLQDVETGFYGRVGLALESRGHETAHLTFSRAAAERLRQRGLETFLLPDLLAEEAGFDAGAEIERIERQYDTPTARDVWRTDVACAGKPEAWCADWTVRHFRAFEHLLDTLKPDIVVPEVGSESMRTVAHLVGVERGITVLFLMYTIFPNPLRLYANTMHAPIVAPDDVRPLEPAELDEIEAFIAQFTNKAKPIRQYRGVRLDLGRLPTSARHLRERVTTDRDNPYLQPGTWAIGDAREKLRTLAAKPMYDDLDPARKFVYFPLHVTDDYKIKRLIPHCVDQSALIEQVSESLPAGYDIVLKEHPMSIGRNSLGMLRRLRRRKNIRLVEPHTSSHDLVKQSEAVIVISSTVGLEALMYNKPVLTMGQPFYSGYGVTVDVDSFRTLGQKVLEVLEFRPDHDRIRQFLHAAMRRCYPGAPVLVDASDENAARVADSLDRAATEGVPESPPLVLAAS
jgi:hypothetical protein